MKKRCMAVFLALALILPCFGTAAVFADETSDIYDELESGSALFDKNLSVTDNIGFATSSSGGLSNLTRIYKLSHDGALDTNTYFTYYSAASMQSFEAVIEQRKCKSSNAVPGEYKFEVSGDGKTFREFTDFNVELDKDNWSKDKWKEGKVSSVSELPANTHYLRIYFPGTQHMDQRDNVAAQFGSVLIKCKDEASMSDMSALAAQVKSVIAGAEIGDKTGQYPQSAVDALTSELEIYNEILDNFENYTPAERKQAMESLNSALELFYASANPPSSQGDPCDTADIAYELSDGVAVTGDNPADFGGDTGRFVRESDLTGGYVIYRADEWSTFTQFTVNAWYKNVAGNVSDDMIIETAPIGADLDNEMSFSKAAVKKEIDDAGWQEGTWRLAKYSVSELPSDTEYVRITFGDSTATDAPDSIQIGSVEWVSNSNGVRSLLSSLIASAKQAISKSLSSVGTHTPEQIADFQAKVDDAEVILNNASSGDEVKSCYVQLRTDLNTFKSSAAQSERIVDECEDTTKFFARSSADIGVASSSPEKFGGDDSRFSRGTAQKGGYLVYAASDTKTLTYFQVNAWYNKYSNKVPTDMILEAAPLGSDPLLDSSYTVLNAKKTYADGDSFPNGAWKMQIYTAATLPANTKYVRVTFGDSSNTGKSWTIQIGSIEWEEQTADYRSNLLPLINKAADLLTNHPVGTQPGMSTKEAYDMLSAQKIAASDLYNSISATAEELHAAQEGLEQAILMFEDAIIRALNWPEGAMLATSNMAETELTLYWPEIIEKADDVVYDVYSDDKLIGSVSQNSYTVSNLKQGKEYTYHVIARKGSEKSKILGPETFKTLRYGDIPAPDFSKISPDDFKDEDYMAPLVWGNDKRGVPYYYYNLHRVLNGVRLEEPNRGMIEIYLTRQLGVYKSFNPRIQEVYLPITYFYTRNDSWNEYYASPEVKYRLEAIIDHTLGIQKSNGAFSEYSSGENSLAGTDFTVNYLGQAMRLLREAKKADPNFPSIDQELFDRADAAIRKGIMFVLTNQGMWNHGKNYSNQYGLVWSAAMCYLEYHPDDTEMIEAFDKQWAKSGELISPAGFYYEDSGFDMPYNLGVHTQSIAAEYHYMRGTKYEADLIKHQTQFIDWLSYNFLVEPDGSYIMVNSAASKRSVPSSVVVWRKDFPISEKIPLARAFVRSKEDVEDEIQRNKDDMTKNGAWPVLPEMTTTGGSQYNPYSIYNRILYQYFPTDEERQEAIEMLPYNAKDYFTQHRADREFAFTFVRRPEYYAIFNAGPKAINSQAFGLGAIWSPEGGTFLLNVGEAKDTKEGKYPLAYNYAWGTKPFKTPLSQNYYRVYENGTVIPEYTVNGERFVASKAIDDLPEGDVTMTYTIGDSGKKKVAFTDDGVNVDVTHYGKFQECFPIMLRKEDKVEMFQNRFRVVRGRAVFEITFDKNVDFELTEKGYKNHRLTLNQLTASTVDDLSYSIRTYIREPELSETAGTIQVEMNNNTTSGGTATVPDIGGGSASLSELTGRTDVTRAQFTAAVVDSLGMLGDPAKYKVFEDIPADAWYREDVLAAVQLGLIVGVDDTHFEPAAIITQEQKEIILERAREFLNKKLSLVKDMMSK